MKLRDFAWWPRTWRTLDYQNVTPEQVNDDGILGTCKTLHGDLIIEVDYYGRTVVGRVGKSLNARIWSE